MTNSKAVKPSNIILWPIASSIVAKSAMKDLSHGYVLHIISLNNSIRSFMFHFYKILLEAKATAIVKLYYFNTDNWIIKSNIKGLYQKLANL